MHNDVSFIMKNIQQMNDYVNKRRKILKKKKEEENYKKRKLGLNANYYNVKTTIPKEFNLKTEQRSKSNKKERDINIINKNMKKKKSNPIKKKNITKNVFINLSGNKNQKIKKINVKNQKNKISLSQFSTQKKITIEDNIENNINKKGI